MEFAFLFLILVSVVIINGVSGSLKKPVDADQCGCLAGCNDKYLADDTRDMEQLSGCRRGCKNFYLMASIPRKIPSKKAIAMAEDKCSYSCTMSLQGKQSIQACIEGCQSGCDHGVIGLGLLSPKVKLTIVIQDDIFAGIDSEPQINAGDLIPDVSEMEQVLLSDPAMRYQFEPKLEATYGGKTRIPITYFTNLPKHKGQNHTKACRPEIRLCDPWILTEPIVCFILTLLLLTLLMVAYLRRPSPKKRLEPEKVPLKLSV